MKFQTTFDMLPETDPLVAPKSDWDDSMVEPGRCISNDEMIASMMLAGERLNAHRSGFDLGEDWDPLQGELSYDPTLNPGLTPMDMMDLAKGLRERLVEQARKAKEAADAEKAQAEGPKPAEPVAAQ